MFTIVNYPFSQPTGIAVLRDSIARKDEDAVYNFLRENNYSGYELTTLIKEFAKEKFCSDERVYERSEYYFLMSLLRRRNPDLRKLIGPVNIPRPGVVGHKGNYTYGLSYDGIRKVLEIQKINAVVLDSLDGLEQFFGRLKEGETKACVADLGLFRGHFSPENQLSYHAVAMLSQRKKRGIRVIILDSLGNAHLSHYHIKNRVPSQLFVELFNSQVCRQSRFQATCNTFAIEDCAMFETYPSLVEEILELNDFSDGELGEDKDVEFRLLPESLLKLSVGDNAIKRALEHQSLLVSHVRESNGGRLIRPSCCERITQYFVRGSSSKKF